MITIRIYGMSAQHDGLLRELISSLAALMQEKLNGVSKADIAVFFTSSIYPADELVAFADGEFFTLKVDDYATRREVARLLALVLAKFALAHLPRCRFVYVRIFDDISRLTYTATRHVILVPPISERGTTGEH